MSDSNEAVDSKSVPEAENADSSFEEKENEYKRRIENLQLSLALREILVDCYDPDLVFMLLEKEKIKFEGDTVSGLDEQIKGLRKTKPFLFFPKAEGIRPANPASSESVTGETDKFLQGFTRKY